MKFTYHDTDAIRTSYLKQIKQFIQEYRHLFPFTRTEHSHLLNFETSKGGVVTIDTWGVETDNCDDGFEELDIVDLEYIIENVFEPAAIESDKTMARSRSENF